MFRKTLILAFGLVLYAGIVLAGSDVTFRWDRNTDQDLAGYRLYQSSTQAEYVLGVGYEIAQIVVADVSDEAQHPSTITIHDVPDGTLYWILTAYDHAGNESGPSNEVTAILDTVPPAPPQNFIIALIQKIAALLNSLFR